MVLAGWVHFVPAVRWRTSLGRGQPPSDHAVDDLVLLACYSDCGGAAGAVCGGWVVV